MTIVLQQIQQNVRSATQTPEGSKRWARVRCGNCDAVGAPGRKLLTIHTSQFHITLSGITPASEYSFTCASTIAEPTVINRGSVGSSSIDSFGKEFHSGNGVRVALGKCFAMADGTLPPKQGRTAVIPSELAWRKILICSSCDCAR